MVEFRSSVSKVFEGLNAIDVATSLKWAMRLKIQILSMQFTPVNTIDVKKFSIFHYSE